MKTDDLIGPALDWAVAKCEGTEPFSDGISWIVDMGDMYRQLPNYSTDWSQAGPIIEREKLWALWIPDQECWSVCTADRKVVSRSPSILLAAMRCYVASKMGDEIEIPEELR